MPYGLEIADGLIIEVFIVEVFVSIFNWSAFIDYVELIVLLVSVEIKGEIEAAYNMFESFKTPET